MDNNEPGVSKNLIYIAIIAVLLVVVAVLLIRNNSDSAPDGGGAVIAVSDDSLRFKREYEDMNSVTRDDGAYLREMYVPAGNTIQYITIAEAYEFSRTGTGVVFLGGAWCRLCRLIVPPIIEAASRYDEGSTIYYVPLIRGGGSSGDELYQELADHVSIYIRHAGTSFANVTGSEVTIESFINQIEERGPSVFQSVLLFYKDGALVGMNVGTVHGHSDSDVPLTPEQVQMFIEDFDRHMERRGAEPCPPGC